MINFLIISKNLNYIKKIINIINSNYDNVRIYSIASCIAEAIQILNTNNIDVILLDSKLLFYKNSEKINNILLSKQSDKYLNSIILFIEQNDIFLEKAKYLKPQFIYRIINKNFNYKTLLNCINEIISIKHLNCKSEIIRYNILLELSYLGYNLSHIGTKYLTDAIEITYNSNSNSVKNLNKYVYPIISQKYNCSICNIKTNINRATEAMFYNCPEKLLLNYFNFFEVKKPNIKIIINTIFIHLDKEINISILKSSYKANKNSPA